MNIRYNQNDAFITFLTGQDFGLKLPKLFSLCNFICIRFAFEKDTFGFAGAKFLRVAQQIA